MSVKTDHIHRLGHDGFRVSGSRTIYFDPWEAAGPEADLIFISHDHYDHCDPPTVKELIGPKTRIITEKDSAAKLKEAGLTAPVTIMEPGDAIEVREVVIKAVPAYNVNKEKEFHPRAKHNLGFVVTMDGQTIYHAGDTDFIPEMAKVKTDVALLPVSGTYVMTAEEAVRAALAIKPKVAIPMHYDKIVGDRQMAEAFKEALAGKVKVEIKEID
ncbi:MBL fold metallo-hydrolase [Deltaproteobacteria bacterium OttesenSCG-928-M10]|nr:MBL fold metallo-hydrolase [Deltaproteobacteria bacterium OttesenSCG-928-M10]